MSRPPPRGRLKAVAAVSRQLIHSPSSWKELQFLPMKALAKKALLASFPVATFLCASCSITGNLYPVSGPLAKYVPLPEIAMKVDGVTGNSGDVSLILPSGERCTGRWSVVAPRMVGVVTQSGSGTISSGLDTVFLQIHGQSFVNMAQPGINRGQAMLTGERGTVIESAFLVGSGTASGHGVAKDNHGNTFKLIF